MDSEKAMKFHYLVAKCLFLCKRACPDLQLDVGFFSGIFNYPDSKYLKKLRWAFQYIRATRNLFPPLEAI